MDATTIVWTIGFLLLLAFASVAVGTGFAMTSSDSPGFWIAKACFAGAAVVAVAFAVYWVVATRQPLPWNVSIPTVIALITVPSLVLALQWLGNLEVQLSTRLFPGKAQTPPLPMPTPDNALKVFLGWRGIAWTTKMPHTILEMAGDKMIEINRSGDALSVTILRIFDDRSNIIARVDEDGFWVENFTRKKRPDPSTLVVFDHNDKEALRIVFINQTSLYVTGVFHHPRVVIPTIVSDEFISINGNRFSGAAFGGNATDISVGASR
jgi:hypothetical protein